MPCDWEDLEALVNGGAILGGGGGGSFEDGFKLARLSYELGGPQIVSLSDVDPEAWVITVSMVGAPAAKEGFVAPMDYVRVVETLALTIEGDLAGLIQNEMGGIASANGLLQSAILGLPVIDAPCNGRAHPLSLMGSLGLHKKPGYRAVQAAKGGDPDRNRHIELLVHGDTSQCAAMVREASIQAGGLVAVARNPVRAAFLEDTAAVGAVAAAISLGRAYLDARRRKDQVEEMVAAHIRGEVVARAKVDHIELKTVGGFDVGRVVLDNRIEVMFWNEYMLLEADGRRVYTFPDLITIFDLATHRPVNSAEIAVGMSVAVVASKKENVILGASMHDNELFSKVEDVLGKPILPYVFGRR